MTGVTLYEVAKEGLSKDVAEQERASPAKIWENFWHRDH